MLVTALLAIPMAVIWMIVTSSITPGSFGVGLVLGFICLKLLGEAAGDEGEAAIGLTLPVLLLNGFLTHEFATAFPNLDETLDATYGAWSLLFAGSILFVGLLTTKIAPQDERV